ncbi:19821_t:CDS:2 [Dentiscutata erythropus]|uniref:19821_t:CDS:1 n=1 Tax=Dentiscutata erythropus TaxID=1348616 RepID=A0A9N9HCM8_9GLOM|nr:19821_t:CDS:2 [Dentiscutata erythropus]
MAPKRRPITGFPSSKMHNKPKKKTSVNNSFTNIRFTAPRKAQDALTNLEKEQALVTLIYRPKSKDHEEMKPYTLNSQEYVSHQKNEEIKPYALNLQDIRFTIPGKLKDALTNLTYTSKKVKKIRYKTIRPNSQNICFTVSRKAQRHPSKPRKKKNKRLVTYLQSKKQEQRKMKPYFPDSQDIHFPVLKKAQKRLTDLEKRTSVSNLFISQKQEQRRNETICPEFARHTLQSSQKNSKTL